MPTESPSEIARFVRLACTLEATARKPGNVHPGASFGDLCYGDFLRSADAVAPVIALAPKLGVGRTVLEAVRQTRQAVGRNTNLGIIFLLSPLAAARIDDGRSLVDDVQRVLQELTVDDAVLVYQAIRLARPGGMGRVAEQDIERQPTETLLAVMGLAAERDAVAAQYATGFDLVLGRGVPHLERLWAATDWECAVIGLHLRIMAEQPDTLIARKCGAEVACESARRARQVLAAAWPERSRGQQKLAELDRWLRADGNRRNPGTTADLVTACLFAALRERRIAVEDERAFGACHA